jgi:hypothetical protein
LATVTGLVTKFSVTPPGFSVASDPNPPGTPLVAFADVPQAYLNAAIIAWGADKKVKVTFPDGGGTPTNVENG